MRTVAIKLSMLVVAASLMASMLSCGGNQLPPFQCRIEITAVIVDPVTGVTTPQKGVVVQGNLSSSDGGSCSPNGSIANFGSTTEKHGDFRCPQCQVNAKWDLTINYNLVIGGCMPNLQPYSIDFACGGAVLPTQCIL